MADVGGGAFRRMTDAEKADAIARMERDAPEWRRRQALVQAREVANRDTIAMLERRVHEEPAPEYVALRGGDYIAIRTCLSDAEEREAAKLLIEWVSKRRPEAAYELVELVTVDGRITKKWLTENPDKFATGDFLEVLLGYFEKNEDSIRQRAERVARTISFRLKPRGAGVRPDAPGPGNSGPPSVG